MVFRSFTECDETKFEELEEFDVFRDDNEMKWYLNHLQSVMRSTYEELKSRGLKG